MATATDTDLEQRIAALEIELGLVKYNFNQVLSWIHSTSHKGEKAAKSATDLANELQKNIIDV